MKVPAWFRENASRFAGDLLWNEPLSRHTYYRIGGPAELLLIPKGRGDLELIREGITSNAVPVQILGAGSNVLASDHGLPGIVLKASRIDLSLSATDKEVLAGASVSVSTLLRTAGREGWCGFELLAGIPGSVGGVVAMNAGTHLGEAKDLLRAIEIFAFHDPSRDRILAVSPSDFEYRKNRILAADELVISTRWQRTSGDPAIVQGRTVEVLTRRKSSQPLDFPSCGSVFKNPIEANRRAWEVIDVLGLRGRRIGNAQFSEKHPNFIVNLGGALAQDVAGLIRLAKSEAQARLGIELHEEVKYLGDFAP